MPEQQHVSTGILIPSDIDVPATEVANDGIVRYVIKVQTSDSVLYVQKRFSDLFEMDQHFRKAFPSIDFVPLPPKKLKVIQQNHRDPWFIEERRILIRRYLRLLPFVFYHTGVFQHFFQTDNVPKQIAQQLVKKKSHGRYSVRVPSSRILNEKRMFQIITSRRPDKSTPSSDHSETLYWTNWRSFAEIKIFFHELSRTLPRSESKALPRLPSGRMLQIDDRDPESIDDRVLILEKFLNEVFQKIDVECSSA